MVLQYIWLVIYSICLKFPLNSMSSLSMEIHLIFIEIVFSNNVTCKRNDVDIGKLDVILEIT